MQNSISLTSFMDEGSLNLYNQEISKQRASRTLSLRQYTRKKRMLQPSKSLPLKAQKALCSSHEQLIDDNSFPFLNNDYLLKLLEQENVSQFAQILDQIQELASISPRVLKKMLNNEEFYDSLNDIFINHLQNDNYPVVVQIINFIEIIFPCVLPEIQSCIIDNIIIFSLSDLLTATDSVTVMIEALNLSSVISNQSSYARDMILCSGIHSTIIEIGNKSDLDSELLDISCKTLLSIFSNPSPIESNDILVEIIEPLFCLLDHCLSLRKIISAHPKAFRFPTQSEDQNNPSEIINWNSLNEQGISHLAAASNIIGCYVEITDKEPSIIYNLFNNRVCLILVSFLDDDSLLLAPSALRLIGNLSVSQKHQIQESLIQAGLVPKLINLIQSPLVVDSLWCFSNLIESSPEIILPLFQEQSEFISKIVEITIESSIDVKQEASYFLSSLIIVSPTSFLPDFLRKLDIIDILVEMLACGVISIIIRCLDCLRKLLLFCQINMCKSASDQNKIISNSCSSDSMFSLESSEMDSNQASDLFSSFLSTLFESDLKDRIDDLIDDQKDKIMNERALIVTKILDEIQEEMESSEI